MNIERRLVGAMTLTRTILIAGAILGAFLATAAEKKPNLVPNPSFEDVSRGDPRGWRQQRWGGEGSFAFAEEGRTGGRSVMISSGGGLSGPRGAGR